jgi:hypothetical protein
MSLHYPLQNKPDQGLWTTHKNRKKWFLTALFLFTIVVIAGGFALALPPYSQNSGAGNLDQGITIFWPYHVLLMIMGFILLFTGFIVARFHKTRSWYKSHMILEVCGGACIIAGIFVGIYMVMLSGFPQLHNIHELLGVTTGILAITAIILGYSIKRATESKKIVRQSHRWLGRIVICLIIITILFGIFFLLPLLGR